MADCVNLKIPSIKKAFKELSSIFNSENIAYALLEKNNSHNLELTPDGNYSDLFQDISKRMNRKEALRKKAIIYTPGYLEFNPWLDSPFGEPSIVDLNNYVEGNITSKKEYSSDDVVYISDAESVPELIFEIDDAIKAGVKVFTFSTEPNELKDFLLTKDFEQTEKDGVVFLTKKIPKEKQMSVEIQESIIKINDTTIDLRKLGFEFALTPDQKRTIQYVADWIDKKELKQKALKTYSGKITEAKSNEIFVFGSNTEGRHDKGAAKIAKDIFGRKPNTAKGYASGGKGKNSYAVITKDLTKGEKSIPLKTIQAQITEMYKFANNYPTNPFNVAYSGEGENLNGYSNEELAEAFANAGPIPENIVFEKEFSKLVYDRVPNWATENILLTGYAGTGKTSVTDILIEYANKNLRPIVASALTNRAVRVQEQFYGDKIATGTLHKVLGFRLDTDIENFNVKKLKFNPKAEPMIRPGGVLIVDESSMTNRDLYNYLQKDSKSKGYRILFIGDDKQFKPVKSKVISPVFTDMDKFVTRLTSQVRQGEGNSLGNTLTRLRKNQSTSKIPLGDSRTSSINKDGKRGIEWTNKSNFLNHVDHLFKTKEFLKDPDYVRIIAYKNDTVSKYNQHVRKALGLSEEIHVGEVLTGYKQVVNKSTKILYNGADYIVTRKKDTKKTFKHPLNMDVTVEALVVDVDLQDTSFPDSKTSTYILSRNNSQETKTSLAKIAYETSKQASKYYRENNWKAGNKVYAQYKSFLSSFQSFEELTIPGILDSDGDMTVHIDKVIDYGYAITSHKSQGGTYQYAMVDETDIDSIYSYDVEAANQSKYVAFSRAAKGVIAMTNSEITNKEAFNFETDSFSEEVEIGTISPELASVLEKDNIANKSC